MDDVVQTQLFPAWREAVKVLIDSGLTYGNTVSKIRLIELCNIRPPESIKDKERFDLEVLTHISAIKKSLLLDHQMYLHSKRNGEYVIVMPEDQTRVALAIGQKAMAKALGDMNSGVTNIAAELLTSDQRAHNADIQAKLSQLAGMVRKHTQHLT